MTHTLTQNFAKRRPALDDWKGAESYLYTEFGKVESALAIPTAATGGYFTVTDPQWGGDNTGARDTGVVVRRILTMIASGLTPIRAIYFPGGEYRFSRNVTLTGGSHDYVTLFGDGPSTRLFLSDIPDETNVESGWMVMLDGTTAAPLVGACLRGLRFDGNKAATDWADSSYGIVGYTDAVLEDCIIVDCWAHDFLTDGFKTFTGGLTFVNPHTFDNDFNGLAVSVDNTFTGVCNIYGHVTHGNLGGLDVGRGCRTFVRGVEAYENDDQGVKYSIGTLFLDIDGVHTYGNGVAGVAGPGFTDTDTTGNGVIIIGSVVTHDNVGPGFRATSANTLDIGRVISYDNDCYVASAVAAYDVLIGSTTLLDYFHAGFLYSENAPNNGVFIDGSTIKTYGIDAIEVVGAQDGGFIDNTTGPVNASIGQMVLRNNNKAGTAGATGSAAQFESTSSTFNIGSLVCYDSQGTPTQTGGLYASSGATVKVRSATFGTGISTPYYVASSGTVILPENAWTALRSTSATTTADFADDTILVDATGGARTVNLKAATNMTGKKYTVKKVDASVNAVTVDPSGGETIDGAGTYPLALQYQSVTFQSDGTTWWIL